MLLQQYLPPALRPVTDTEVKTKHLVLTCDTVTGKAHRESPSGCYRPRNSSTVGADQFPSFSKHNTRSALCWATHSIPSMARADVPAVKMQRPQLARLVNTVKPYDTAGALGLNNKMQSDNSTSVAHMNSKLCST